MVADLVASIRIWAYVVNSLSDLMSWQYMPKF